MSRLAANQPQVVKPRNDVYTGLAFVGLLVVIAGLIIIFLRAKDLMPPNGLM
ncbi:MAG TPA: hypothetical protein VIL86_10625 [Tepidisphaeraceae bacterium]|jgi:hypothetical protein